MLRAKVDFVVSHLDMTFNIQAHNFASLVAAIRLGLGGSFSWQPQIQTYNESFN